MKVGGLVTPQRGMSVAFIHDLTTRMLDELYEILLLPEQSEIDTSYGFLSSLEIFE
jgi:hypothetical protein